VSNTQPAAQGRRDMCELARLGWAASPNAVVGALSLSLSLSLSFSLCLQGGAVIGLSSFAGLGLIRSGGRGGLDSDSNNNSERMRLLRRSK
jgi:hypothetical protein